MIYDTIAFSLFYLFREKERRCRLLSLSLPRFGRPNLSLLRKIKKVYTHVTYASVLCRPAGRLGDKKVAGSIAVIYRPNLFANNEALFSGDRRYDIWDEEDIRPPFGNELSLVANNE